MALAVFIGFGIEVGQNGERNKGGGMEDRMSCSARQTFLLASYASQRPLANVSFTPRNSHAGLSFSCTRGTALFWISSRRFWTRQQIRTTKSPWQETARAASRNSSIVEDAWPSRSKERSRDKPSPEASSNRDERLRYPSLERLSDQGTNSNASRTEWSS